jgi:CBS domain-containing protein
MAEKNIGAVLVLEREQPVGIFSERDYARQVILKGKTSKDTPVHEVMTSRVVFIRPEQNIEECMAVMTAKRFRHLPVLDEGKLAGILSIGDVVKAVISERNSTSRSSRTTSRAVAEARSPGPPRAVGPVDGGTDWDHTPG